MPTMALSVSKTLAREACLASESRTCATTIMANNALDFAVQIARKSGAKIILLNVIEGVRNYSFNTMGEIDNSLGEDEFIIKKLIDQTQENLTKFAEVDKNCKNWPWLQNLTKVEKL